jgi:hypothetical protein
MKILLIAILSISVNLMHAQNSNQKQIAPKYSTLLGQDLSGSGFHFTHGNKRYLACSLHQFGGKSPTVMGSMEFDTPIKIKNRIYVGKDTQILTYVSSELDKQSSLKFDPSLKPSIGDKVYCYNFDDSFTGEIISISEDKKTCSVKMSKPYPAGGNSGSPVVSAKSGTVIGVLLTANDTKTATIIGFELLPSKIGPAEQDAAPNR